MWIYYNDLGVYELDTTIIIILAYLLILAGIAGIIIPGLPGLVLILAGILVYGWHVGFDVLGTGFLTTMILLTVVGTVVDILGSMVGAKKYGASTLSLLAILIGVIFGIFTMGPIGIIVGPVIAVALTEILFNKKSPGEAFKVTFGIILGLLGGIVLRLVIGIGMTIAFTINLILIHFSI